MATKSHPTPLLLTVYQPLLRRHLDCDNILFRCLATQVPIT